MPAPGPGSSGRAPLSRGAACGSENWEPALTMCMWIVVYSLIANFSCPHIPIFIGINQYNFTDSTQLWILNCYARPKSVLKFPRGGDWVPPRVQEGFLAAGVQQLSVWNCWARKRPGEGSGEGPQEVHRGGEGRGLLKQDLMTLCENPCWNLEEPQTSTGLKSFLSGIKGKHCAPVCFSVAFE